MFSRPWALWRRVQYVVGLSVLLLLISTGFYYSFLYTAPTCFDGEQNGLEAGVDCDGSCLRICAFSVAEPNVEWVRSFEVVPGQYNAVAYVVNENQGAGVAELPYTFKLYDADGLIVERKGVTVLPPNSVYPIFEGRINTGDRIPLQTQIEFEENVIWLPAEAGSDQFEIVQRELAAVDSSAPRLDAVLRNDAFTEARDVEVVAIIFDGIRNALTASRTEIPYFGGRSSEEVVFTWRQPIAKTIRSCEVPTDVVLAIDLSGSMNDDGDTPPEPITSVLTAAEAFVSRLNTRDQVGVVTYATNADTVKTLTNDKMSVAETIQDLAIEPEEEVGSTNTGEALIRTMEEMSSSRHSPNARKVLVLLSDGLATAPEDEPEAYALTAADALKETGTQIFTIGLGDNVNADFMRRIASSENNYFFAPTVSTLSRVYESITAEICEDGPAVIEIIPKTKTVFPAFPG